MNLGVAEAGTILVTLAFSVTAYQLAANLVGARWRLPSLLLSARNAGVGVAVLLTAVALLLAYALLASDFALRYVWEVSSRSAPWAVRLSGFWGGQAGSLLFWSWGLALFTSVAVWRTARHNPDLAPSIGGTLAGIQLFFLFLLAFVTPPFERLPVPAADGRGLNPLLWDDGMRLHPPLLLTGYMSFSVPFAFAVAALVTGRLDRAWLAAVRGWVLLAWAIQGAGLLVGAWWAYHVLGWGGYWGWDPVENVALLPWLIATALLHSIRVQERRRLLKVWNLGLLIATFALALFGTFIVRSGVIASVHSFAQSTVGPYFFAFLGLTLIGSLGLLFYRLPALGDEGTIDSLASREAGFLLNNFLLAALTAATFWGTIYPLLSEVFRGVKVAVGPPFYQQVNGPLLLALLVLMGLGPLLAWHRTSLPKLWRNIRWPAGAWVVTSLLLRVLGMRDGLAALAFGACVFVVGSIVLEFVRGTRVRQRTAQQGWLSALLTIVALDRRRYGGYVVHLGMVFVAVGAIASTAFQDENAATLQRGQTIAVGRYTLRLNGLFEQQQPGVRTVLARLDVQEGERSLGQVAPERRIHTGWEQQPTTGVAIQTVWPSGDDLYVLLVGWQDDGSATIRVLVNPLVSFIWIGGALFLAGTVLAGWPVKRTRPVLAMARAPAAAMPRPREAALSEA